MVSIPSNENNWFECESWILIKKLSMMKIYKIKNTGRLYISLMLVSLMTITSCDQDFGTINDSYKANLYEADMPGLVNGIIAKMVKSGTLNRITTSWLYQWNQSAAMYSASGYRLDDSTTGAWKQYYEALANSIDVIKMIEEDENSANMTNISATVKVLMAEKALETTLLYGDIPYSEAGRGFYSSDGYRPVYETQESVMKAAIDDLSWAVDNFSTSGNQVSLGSGDTLFHNDIAMWIKYANSLRLRYAMTMRDKDSGYADAVITSALSKPLLAADENVLLGSATIPGLSISRDGYYRGNSYTRMGSTMFDAMSSTNAVDGSGIYDLRCSILFESNEDDEWVPYPQVPGNNTATVTGNPYSRNRTKDAGRWANDRSNFAAINTYYVNERSIPQIVISGSEISFIKAELYNRGIAVGVNQAMAESFYLEGITASVNYWHALANSISVWVVNKPDAVPDPADLTAMLTDVNVAYAADATVALNQIYKQSWISLFHQPFKSWDLQRRTGATPGVSLPSNGLVVDFNSLTYPPSERETNRVNWTAITGGNDSEKDKIWIHK